MTTWIDVSDVNDIDREDVMRFDAGAQTYAIYRASDGSFHATDWTAPTKACICRVGW